MSILSLAIALILIGIEDVTLMNTIIDITLFTIYEHTACPLKKTYYSSQRCLKKKFWANVRRKIRTLLSINSSFFKLKLKIQMSNKNLE